MVDKHMTMAVEQPAVTDADDLTDADRAILDELQVGARTKKAIVDATGLHRNTVGNRLDVLEAAEFIECVHETTALYELIDDPREADGKAIYQAGDTEPVDHTDPSVTVDELREERDELRDELDAVREQSVDIETLLRALEDIEAACERGDGAAVQDALRRAKDVIDDA
jgi:DNA-binding Lrp family transcriptional regulator